MNVVMLNDEPFGLEEIYQAYPEIEHVIYLSKLIGKCNMSIRNASLESLEKVAVCIVGWDTRNKEYRNCNAYHILMDKIYDNMGMYSVFKATEPEFETILKTIPSVTLMRTLHERQEFISEKLPDGRIVFFIKERLIPKHRRNEV